VFWEWENDNLILYKWRREIREYNKEWPFQDLFIKYKKEKIIESIRSKMFRDKSS
jgi:transposase-like protein